MELIEKIEIIQHRLLDHLPPRPRLAGLNINSENRGLMLLGSRGVGKTTWLLSQLRLQNMLYISCDHPAVGTSSLTNIAESAFLKGYQGVAFDEVHFAKDWSLHAKSLYDSHPKKKYGFQIA